MKPHNEERALHRRLLHGDATAVHESCVRYIPRLQSRLSGTAFGARFPELLGEAIDTAVFNYVKRPAAYDPNRLGLAAYLRMAAWHDLLSLIERERRQTRAVAATAPTASVAVVWPDWDEERAIAIPRGLTPVQVFTALARAIPDPTDRLVVRLMVIEEVRQTAVFARALGITDLEPTDQERTVQRTKDRLRRRLRRLGVSLCAATPSEAVDVD